MKVVMWDLLKAQELTANDTSLKKKNAFKDSATLLFSQVFALHHIQKNIFYSSYNYYLGDPEKLSVLLDSLSAYANRDRYSQYMHPPKIPGNSNPQYNHSSHLNILNRKTFLNRKKHPDSLTNKTPAL